MRNKNLENKILLLSIFFIAKQNPKADFCMSWKMGITLEDYLRNLKVET